MAQSLTLEFNKTSCDICESTHVERVGLIQALFHTEWCPHAPCNNNLPVHPMRRRGLGQLEACGGVIKRAKSKMYVCQRCYSAAAQIESLMEG